MMSSIVNEKVARILELFEPVDSDNIRKGLNARLKQLGIEAYQLNVDDVLVDMEGNIVIDFANTEHVLPVSFHVDQEHGPEAIAIIEDEDDEEETDFISIDLSDKAVPLLITKFGPYINLLNLEWFDIGLANTIAYILDDDSPTFESMDELKKTVIRNGKKVKVDLVRRKRKKRLTNAQRAGIRRGAVKRKAKSAQTSRKRKKSVLLRKRSKLKRGNPRGLKVRGTK